MPIPEKTKSTPPIPADTLTARDGAHESPWQSLTIQASNKNYSNTIYDVLIIGGGITGITTALLLQNAGKNV